MQTLDASDPLAIPLSVERGAKRTFGEASGVGLSALVRLRFEEVSRDAARGNLSRLR